MSPNMIEQARQAGGEELVAKLRLGEKIQQRIADAINKVAQEEIDAADDKELCLVALCEATSEAYAISVTMLADAAGIDQKEATVSAFKSMAGNLADKFETLAARKSGVGDKIKAAAAAGGAK